MSKTGRLCLSVAAYSIVLLAVFLLWRPGASAAEGKRLTIPDLGPHRWAVPIDAKAESDFQDGTLWVLTKDKSAVGGWLFKKAKRKKK